MIIDSKQLVSEHYEHGFNDGDENVLKFGRGLTRQTVIDISRIKQEPAWMLDRRLRALDIFSKKPLPQWGGNLEALNFDEIIYYVRPAERQGKTWDDVPVAIKATFERLGIPEAERQFLAGVSAQYESEVVYHSIHEDLVKQGVICTDTDSALREYPEIISEYFGTVMPPEDNKFAALNTAV